MAYGLLLPRFKHVKKPLQRETDKPRIPKNAEHELEYVKRDKKIKNLEEVK